MNLELKGKKVRHCSYGEGVITEFYERSLIIRIRCDNQPERPYAFPDDFDSGILLAEDSELIEFIAEFKKSVRYRLQASKTFGSMTPNKDVMKFFKESCEILDDLKIRYGTVAGVRVIDPNPEFFGLCRHTKDDVHLIDICSDVLADDIRDHDVYTIILHELIHTCDGGIKHNKKFREYGSLIERFYGYTIYSRIRLLCYKPIVLSSQKG